MKRRDDSDAGSSAARDPVVGNWRRVLNPFDLFVLSGATMNLIVVAWLVGYWLLHR